MEKAGIMLRVIIMGYGFAGRSLHHRCLSKMLQLGWNNVLKPGVVAIDKQSLLANITDVDVICQTELTPIPNEQADYRVLHVCSPPQYHFDNIKTALECGYRQIIVEKPAVSTQEELRQLIALERFYEAKILVVANWVSSAAVTEVVRLLESQEYGNLKQITVVQNKSRFMRSRQRSGEHVFDIEMPHQVALALFLGGPAELEEARVEDMIMPDKAIPNLGIGDLTLSHVNGVKSELRSSLVHTARERYLEVVTELGYKIRAAFPSGGDDSYSRLLITSPLGHDIANKLLFDDPLTLCFINAYQYFIRSQQSPDTDKPLGMDLSFNEYKVEILEQAKRLASTTKTEIGFQGTTLKNHGATVNASTVL